MARKVQKSLLGVLISVRIKCGPWILPVPTLGISENVILQLPSVPAALTATQHAGKSCLSAPSTAVVVSQLFCLLLQLILLLW
jgi:hypothetical protein